MPSLTSKKQSMTTSNCCPVKWTSKTDSGSQTCQLSIKCCIGMSKLRLPILTLGEHKHTRYVNLPRAAIHGSSFKLIKHFIWGVERLHGGQGLTKVDQDKTKTSPTLKHPLD
eukprot:1982858-Amphidinium_carterae.1